MFDPATILRPHLGVWWCLCRGNFSGRAHSVLCEMSLFISTFVHVVPPMFDPAYYWGPRGYPKQGVSGRHPDLIMVGYTIYVPVHRCRYLVGLTKMLWAAGL